MVQQSAFKSPQLGFSERLRTLRQAHSEIDTALLLDFRAGTVLCASALVPRSQERLDEIVAFSARIFDGRFGDRRQFSLVTRTAVLVVQLVEAGTALAVIYEPDVDLERAIAMTRDAVDGLKD